MTTLDKRLEQAFQCSEKKNYSEALRLCSEVIVEYPNEPVGYRKRSHVYARMQQWKNAIEDLDHALSIDPQEPADYFTRGRLFLRVGDATRATEDLTKAIELGDYHGDHYYTEMARFFRAEALLRLHRYDEALSDCEHVRDDLQAYIYPAVKSKADIVKEANAQQPAGS